jgi:hypothetical protein
MTSEERAYCELALSYMRNEQPELAFALDAAMREMECAHPEIAVLAEIHTDDELAAMLAREVS